MGSALYHEGATAEHQKPRGTGVNPATKDTRSTPRVTFATADPAAVLKDVNSLMPPAFDALPYPALCVV